MNNQYLLKLLETLSRKDIIDFTGINKSDLSKYISGKKPIPKTWSLVFYLFYKCEEEGLILDTNWNKENPYIGSNRLDK